MKQYVEYNLNDASNLALEHMIKMLANVMEGMIFLFMGLAAVNNVHIWNVGFILAAIICCLFYRFLGIAIFSWLANRWRLHTLTPRDILTIGYGGIRGAVAFMLSLILQDDYIERKSEFVTATVCVIYFTVFFQVRFLLSTS